MAFVPGKCPICGEDIYVSTDKDRAFCGACGAQFMTEAAITFGSAKNADAALPASPSPEPTVASAPAQPVPADDSTMKQYTPARVEQAQTIAHPEAPTPNPELEIAAAFTAKAVSPNVEDRREAAGNPAASTTALAILSLDNDWYTRILVAKNPNTPVEVLKTMINDSASDVREIARKRLFVSEGSSPAPAPAGSGTTTFLDQWKTSVGASIGGILVSYGVFGTLSIILQGQATIDGLTTWAWLLTMVMIGMSIACFLVPPRRFKPEYTGTNEGVSFVNCFIAGFFGCLWNSNLTNRNSRQVSHYVIGVLFLIASLYYGINAASLMSYL